MHEAALDDSLKMGDLSDRPFSFYIKTCACNRRPTTSNKSQPSRSEVTNTRANQL